MGTPPPGGQAQGLEHRKVEALERIARAMERQAVALDLIGEMAHNLWSWLPDNDSSIPLFSGGNDDKEGGS